MPKNKSTTDKPRARTKHQDPKQETRQEPVHWKTKQWLATQPKPK